MNSTKISLTMFPAQNKGGSGYNGLSPESSDPMERISRDDLIDSFLNTFAGTAPARASRAQALDLSRFVYDTPALGEFTRERLRHLPQSLRLVAERELQTPNSEALTGEWAVPYAEALNPRQLAAVTTTEGPLLVLAGAGSGKTRTVIYRLSYLLEKGVDPSRILLLTFTRKAAQEMLLRAQELLHSNRAEKVAGGTFHAFAAHVLRRYAKLLDLPSNFTIVDAVDSEDILDLIRQELKFDKKSRAFPKKGRIQEVISKARNCNISVADVIAREFTGLEDYAADLTQIAEVYRRYKQGNLLMDYDDLIEHLRTYLIQNETFRHKLQAQFDYVMVDEYQDTNLVQKDIADLIAKRTRNLMVVGDDAQSIYAFRGAHFENILRFPEAWPDCRIVKLEQNYRSQPAILDLTNAIMAQARLGYPKTLFSELPSGPMPLITRQYSAEEEAGWIVDRLLALREQGVATEDMAVLYRAGFHSTFIQAELLRRDIPYVVHGGIRFVERRHVKDLIAYLRLTLNPMDAVSWHRVLKLMPGIGQVTARTVIEHLRSHGGQIHFEAFRGKKFYAHLEALQVAFAKATATGIPVTRQVEVFLDYYGPLLQQVESDHTLRMQDLQILVQLAAKYKELEPFLSDFALDPPSNKFQDGNRPLINEREEKPVVLSTIHSAKGLEWRVVCVPHLLDGLFPGNRALKNLEDLEEERRLFYVACSRAKEYLFLTLPGFHQGFDAFFTLPSRFLAELPTPTYDSV
jgi:DNA helicase-2/ATP-dependent DNA helicase PcrA